jgi:hypothetical protein
MIAQQSSAVAIVPKGHPINNRRHTRVFQRRVRASFIPQVPEGRPNERGKLQNEPIFGLQGHDGVSRPVKVSQAESRLVKLFLKKIFFLAAVSASLRLCVRSGFGTLLNPIVPYRTLLNTPRGEGVSLVKSFKPFPSYPNLSKAIPAVFGKKDCLFSFGALAKADPPVVLTMFGNPRQTQAKLCKPPSPSPIPPKIPCASVNSVKMFSCD